jgi:UDP-sugar transporter A1/2/3
VYFRSEKFPDSTQTNQTIVVEQHTAKLVDSTQPLDLTVTEAEEEVEEMNRPTHKERKDIKIASLVVLTLQNAILTVSMRHSRSRPGDMFISSTAVVLSEAVKLYTSLLLVYMTEAYNLPHFMSLLHSTIIKQPLDTLKVCVPSIVYVIQNNLLYLASTHLDAATLQVTYQLKILTTAFFAVLILRRSLNYHQWFSLLILILGIALVQISDPKESAVANPNQSRLLGMLAALSACGLSGFAGIYFEKILKGSEISVWMRNVQLAVIAVPAGLGTVLISDWNKLQEKGFFFGYDYFVIFVILMQALGGLLVAVVVKYADNILKGFATSLAIILSCVLSIYFFDFQLNWKFAIGAVFVMISVFLYGIPVRSSKAPRSYVPTKTETEEA